MIGTSLKRYEILEELGQGGMSVVYRGRDTALDREVAVKVLHEHLAKDAENRRRFRREAQAIARLQHDHILDVFDYSDEEDDRSFIVMEHIPGDNLREFVDEHGTPPPEVAAMMGTVVADALAHAHDHGVIHRDLKPDNIMVSEEGILKLMDFGIAHVADAETMTQTGNLLGSPAHMAPEIIDGNDVNRRSDIFSFGTVLYWLSTGEFPFQGDNAPHLLRQVLECNYDDPESVDPRMPRELSRIICRCLSREPEDRYGDVEELRRDLVDSLHLLEEIDISEDLESYFNDPEGYTSEFESAIVDRLIERGRAAMERGDVPEAISHFNRVLGYEPDNEVVQRELEELDEEEIETRQIAIIAAVVLAVAATSAYVLVGPGSGPDAPVDGARGAVATGVDRAARTHGERHAQRAGASTARAVQSSAGRVGAGVAGRMAALHTGRRSRSVSADPRRTVSTRFDGASNEEPTAAETRDGDGSAGRNGDPSPAEAATSDRDAGTPSDTGSAPEPETYAYKFKVRPLAATVYIDGREYSPIEVSDGVELERGDHRIEVVSAGCKPYESRFRVDGPREEKTPIVLKWRPATVEVTSNIPAVVYVDGDRNRPHRIDSGERQVRIQFPFGKADSNRTDTRRKTTLEVRAQHDFELVREQTVELRPGEKTAVNINFPRDGP